MNSSNFLDELSDKYKDDEHNNDEHNNDEYNSDYYVKTGEKKRVSFDSSADKRIIVQKYIERNVPSYMPKKKNNPLRTITGMKFIS